MASSLPLPKSHFLGKTHLPIHPHKLPFKPSTKFTLTPSAKFDLFQIMGGRGLCNGEQGVLQELSRQKTLHQQSQTSSPNQQEDEKDRNDAESSEDGFGKELLGLTGGFPGGEKGLNRFIEQNPPPEKMVIAESEKVVRKSKPPELPLLMPGMIAIVKNSNNPFYMYCGIVQRITDGKAGVLFEGGNWDRLVTFRLDELQRREKGPPMKNPKSAILEELIEKKSES
uniref:Chlororespiratory reduction31 n=1 Tax=Francoa sonchifolia TaxID=23250 RepID=A0A0F7GYA7_9ROSI